jgi:hypothetical protein
VLGKVAWRLWCFYHMLKLWIWLLPQRDFWGIDWSMSLEKIVLCWRIAADVWRAD